VKVRSSRPLGPPPAHAAGGDVRARRPRLGAAGASLAPVSSLRIGIGFDAHAFEEGVPLVLGGVSFDHPRGLGGLVGAPVAYVAAEPADSVGRDVGREGLDRQRMRHHEHGNWAVVDGCLGGAPQHRPHAAKSPRPDHEGSGPQLLSQASKLQSLPAEDAANERLGLPPGCVRERDAVSGQPLCLGHVARAVRSGVAGASRAFYLGFSPEGGAWPDRAGHGAEVIPLLHDDAAVRLCFAKDERALGAALRLTRRSR